MTGETGAGGAFSQPETFGERSMFNKEKWLPASQELPFLISHHCCGVMKKAPMHAYSSKTGRMPIIGTLAEESRLRKQGWVRHGCNAFDSKKPTSQPMSFWTEQDVLEFISRSGIKICDVYGDVVRLDKHGQTCLEGGKYQCTGCKRTG